VRFCFATETHRRCHSRRGEVPGKSGKRSGDHLRLRHARASTAAGDAQYVRDQKAYVLDIVADKAESLARELSRFLEIAVVATANLREAARESDTASPARRRAAITCSRITFRPARSLQPWELTARTNRNSELSSPTKSSWTCWSSARAGELYHALENGMREEDVYAELGDIIIGKEPRRTSKEEVVIFDAIGTTLQDAVAAVAVYQKAFEIDAGLTFDLFR
jgi:hypothetical protein